MVQSLNVSGTTNYTTGSAKVVSSNLSISDTENGTLNGASVIINSNFKASEDRLGISGQEGTSGTVEGLTWNYNTTSGVLSITGTGTNETYQKALRQVTYSNSSNTPTTTARSIEFALGTTLGSAENNHFYEFVSAENISWTDAQTQASSRSYLGLKGYLATITTATEQNFIQSKVQGNGWIGASDATTEGDWRWVTGPETGTQFWSNGSTVDGKYSNWDSDEPNDLNNQEDYGHVIGNSNIGQTSLGKWNDLSNTVEGGNYIPQGYIVEYGGSEGDPTLKLTGSVTVTLTDASTNAKTSKFDLTGDAKPDILWRNSRTDETAVWKLNGTTLEESIALPTTFNTAWKLQGQADFTGDGKTDFLWRNYSTGENSIWEMDGTTFKQASLTTSVADLAWEIKGQSDFTGDGKTDILWRNSRTGENAIWKMDGINLQESVSLTTTDTGWKIKGLADFTGDGKDEILWRNNSTGENAIWQLDGTTLKESSTALTTVTDTAWDIVAQADFTGDGKVDVLWRNYRTGENSVWQMDGTTLKESTLLTTVVDTRWEVEGVADFTSDGKVDILWRNYGTDETAIWRMNGTNLEESVALSKTGSTNWETSFPSSYPAGTVA
ncbi:MAG: FG-GAP-like repeat-containing protein [Brasilonema sp.]